MEGNDEENGPDDASGIVWAHSKFFFPFKKKYFDQY